MKKLLIIGLLFLLTGCVDTFNSEPLLKESERISVLEKAKTDSLKTVVEMDNNIYLVYDNSRIIGKTPKEDGHLVGGILIGVIIGLFFALLLSTLRD